MAESACPATRSLAWLKDSQDRKIIVVLHKLEDQLIVLPQILRKRSDERPKRINKIFILSFTDPLYERKVQYFEQKSVARLIKEYDDLIYQLNKIMKSLNWELISTLTLI